jgi:hypothetical protein
LNFFFSTFLIYLFIYLFWWDWGLNSGLCTCKAGSISALSVTPPVHFDLIIFDMGSHKLFAQAGLEPQSS